MIYLQLVKFCEIIFMKIELNQLNEDCFSVHELQSQNLLKLKPLQYVVMKRQFFLSTIFLLNHLGFFISYFYLYFSLIKLTIMLVVFKIFLDTTSFYKILHHYFFFLSYRFSYNQIVVVQIFITLCCILCFNQIINELDYGCFFFGLPSCVLSIFSFDKIYQKLLEFFQITYICTIFHKRQKSSAFIKFLFLVIAKISNVLFTTFKVLSVLLDFSKARNNYDGLLLFVK
eukprot:TRINITY_DN15565_c0_g1_i1.p1 TRINITY_DN15565_c0_g1~~TRINITY_DN15565_c0_g1_i1.p1  ORF type:complete len:229 (-),score=-19.04 TRINITY_DN15565_c0_g1_i1:445-1131(-)